MALPSSGQLSLSDIYGEIYGSHTTQQASLHAMSLAAGKSVPDTINEFHSYSAGWVFDFAGSPTYTINNNYEKDVYDSLVFTGRQSGQIATLNLEATFNENNPSAFSQVWYSKNSGSWISLGSWTFSMFETPLSITNVDYNDDIRIRMHLLAYGLSGNGDFNTFLTGGTMTTGSGSVTASGSTSWTLHAYVI